LFQEEIELEDRSNWVKKKAIISTAGIIAFQRVKEAGMEEFTLLSKSIEQWKTSLYPLQQSSKEVRNEECIGEDQCPNGHSFETNFDPSYFSYFTDTKCLIPVHLFFYPFNLIFKFFLHNLNNSKTHNKKNKNQK
jgi:hypothetical protein